MSKTMWVGIIIILFLYTTAFLAPVISPDDPLKTNVSQKLQSMSIKHPMGTDQLGRDMLSRILYAARISLTASIAVVVICLIVGTTIGCIAGYFGGIVDEVLMRLVDVMMAFPSFILNIAITGILGPSVINIILALSLTSWVGYARMVRSSVLSIKNRTFIEAAQAMGSNKIKIIINHIIPNVIHPIIVYATFNASHTILAISGLSFLGLGVQPPTPEWGAMLNEATTFMGASPHLFIFPGLMIMLTVLGFNLFGDGLRDFMDPRLKKEVDL